ncbi:MAG: hypothetical protein RI964_2209 [Pseudomonadota bacterium]|jgi:ABC-type polysaccharide/polyol phosphate export permease
MLLHLKNAIYLAWMDIQARYKKSAFGPLWLTFGNLISVIGLGIVWGSMLKEDLSTFLPSIATGLITWQFISISISESCDIFIAHAFIIRNVKMPLFFFTSRLIARHLINLMHNTPIIIGVMLYYHLPFNQITLLSLLGIVLVTLNLAWLTFVIGIASARYRDISYAITSFMPILFFLTPIIFRPDHIPGVLRAVADYNPLAHFVSIIRYPILGQVPSLSSYIIVCSILLIGVILTNFVNRKYSRKLAFWI